MSIIDTLITNRTQGDVDTLRGFLDTPFVSWSAEMIAEFNAAAMKGAYNYTDLNRVTEAMDYINNQLVGYGYQTGYQRVEIPHEPEEELDQYTWYESDLSTESLMDAYLANVEALRSTLGVLESTPKTPESMEALTWVEANNIEQILLDVQQMINQVVESFSRSNAYTFWSGYRPLPSSKTDYGRTWEELDTMNTEWKNWQVADWYLLLYGNLEAEGVVT